MTGSGSASPAANGTGAVRAGAGAGASGAGGAGGAASPSGSGRHKESTVVPNAEPEVPVAYNEFRALTASGRTGEAMVMKKLDREQRYTKLTKREEDDSIGDWLFGVGGIRGLRCVLLA